MMRFSRLSHVFFATILLVCCAETGTQSTGKKDSKPPMQRANLGNLTGKRIKLVLDTRSLKIDKKNYRKGGEETRQYLVLKLRDFITDYFEAQGTIISNDGHLVFYVEPLSFEYWTAPVSLKQIRARLSIRFSVKNAQSYVLASENFYEETTGAVYTSAVQKKDFLNVLEKCTKIVAEKAISNPLLRSALETAHAELATINQSDSPKSILSSVPPMSQNQKNEISQAFSLNSDLGEYYALLIGNNEYKYLPKLKSAVHDASEIAQTLENLYGFKVEILTDATRSDIISALNRLRRTLGNMDNLLIYYAGHGILDEAADEGYWLPIDAEPGVETNWIANSFMTASIRAIAAKHIMIIADSCYAGKLTRGVIVVNKTADYLSRIAMKRARTVLSSGGLEPVLDSGGKNNHSVFASAFLDALTENNEAIDGTQLFLSIRRAVMLNSNQTPEYSDIRNAGHDGGDFIFMRR